MHETSQTDYRSRSYRNNIRGFAARNRPLPQIAPDPGDVETNHERNTAIDELLGNGRRVVMNTNHENSETSEACHDLIDCNTVIPDPPSEQVEVDGARGFDPLYIPDLRQSEVCNTNHEKQTC